MRRMTYFVMALALVLGFTQCKKEQTNNQDTESHLVPITLTVGSGTRAVVDPVYTNPGTGETYASVAFENGDVIHVGFNNKCVGTLTYNGSNFTGSITLTSEDEQITGQYLHFYFLGGLGFTSTLNETNTEATVVISDQSSKYPVISYAPSSDPYTGGGAYSATLKSKCSIMKFNVNTPSTSAICITGMNNKVTLTFNPEAEETDDGFTYGMDGNGVIKMHGVTSSNTETWAVVLPQDEYTTIGDEGTAYTDDFNYLGCRPKIPAITMNQYHDGGINMSVSESAIVDLLFLTDNYTAKNGQTLINMTSGKYITIPDGATVKLRDAQILSQSKPGIPGITCLGNATLILEGSNRVLTNDRAAIEAPPAGYTLVIDTDPGNPGSIYTSVQTGRAIGGSNVGNITINGGTVDAIGGIGYSSGTGGGITINGGTVRASGGIGNSSGTCGNITINEGTVNAYRNSQNVDYGSALIGSGQSATGGKITINDGTVSPGILNNYDNTNSGAGIGSGYQGTCGIVTINGGTVDASGGGNHQDVAGSAAIGCGYQGSCSGVIIGNGITRITTNLPFFYGTYNFIGASTNGGTFGGLTIGSNNFGNSEPTSTGNIANSQLTVSEYSTNTMTIVHQ